MNGGPLARFITMMILVLTGVVTLILDINGIMAKSTNMLIVALVATVIVARLLSEESKGVVVRKLNQKNTDRIRSNNRRLELLLKWLQANLPFKAGRGIRFISTEEDGLGYDGMILGIGTFVILLNSLEGKIYFLVVGHPGHVCGKEIDPDLDELTAQDKADVLSWHQAVINGEVQPNKQMGPHLAVIDFLTRKYIVASELAI